VVLAVRPARPEPVVRVDDPVFGPLVWSDDDESWVGEYGGYPIAIGIERSESTAPSPELLAYAREFLGPAGATFTRNLAEARTAHTHEFEQYRSEFAGLKVEMLNFHMSKRGAGCFINLGEGERDRSWRAEFEGLKCLGFGFDT
jgi:hypothetical protein